ncbi:MAG: rhodanese-like domain-containing protein [Syntrophotaleaceae bacterium]
MKKLTAEELLAAQGTHRIRLVDVRSVDAYNGWRFNGEARGGHIRGARSLPVKWLDYIDWPEIIRTKNILPEHAIVVYSDNREQMEKVAGQFSRIGYPDVALYPGLLDEWMPDRDLPMECLPNYRHLVPASWLDGLLKTGRAPEYDNDRFVLCHAHYQNRAAYEKGHIPGAVDLDTNTLESPDNWNRRSPEELKLALEGLGIAHDTTVILYGRFSFPDNNDPFPGSAAGHLGAIRCALIMMYAGVKDVRVLNGGLQSWIDAGLPLSTEDTPRRPVSDFGAPIPGRTEFIVDTPQAKEILQTPGQNLVSVRSWDEFIGKVSGYNYIQKKGRIPGAVFGNCGSDAYHMENYRNLDHTTREYHEIVDLWAEVGVTRETYNAYYCGTGWRGSEAFFNAWLMGWPRISVYDGGWFEWSADENNPVATGVP